eukprot:25295-Amphidinium_carterae.1
MDCQRPPRKEWRSVSNDGDDTSKANCYSTHPGCTFGRLVSLEDWFRRLGALCSDEVMHLVTVGFVRCRFTLPGDIFTNVSRIDKVANPTQC